MQKGRESRLNGERENKKGISFVGDFRKGERKESYYLQQKNYMANVNFHSVTPVWNESTKKGKRRFAFLLLLFFFGRWIFGKILRIETKTNGPKRNRMNALSPIFFLITIPTSPCTCREDIIVTDTTFYRLDAQTAVTTSAKKKNDFHFLSLSSPTCPAKPVVLVNNVMHHLASLYKYYYIILLLLLFSV